MRIRRPTSTTTIYQGCLSQKVWHGSFSAPKSSSIRLQSITKEASNVERCYIIPSSKTMMAYVCHYASPLCNCDFMQSNNMQNLLLMIKLPALFGQNLAFEEARTKRADLWHFLKIQLILVWRSWKWKCINCSANFRNRILFPCERHFLVVF